MQCMLICVNRVDVYGASTPPYGICPAVRQGFALVPVTGGSVPANVDNAKLEAALRMSLDRDGKPFSRICLAGLSASAKPGKDETTEIRFFIKTSAGVDVFRLRVVGKMDPKPSLLTFVKPFTLMVVASGRPFHFAVSVKLVRLSYNE